MPAVTADENGIESLPLRFLQNLEARCHAACHEDYPWLARFEIRYVGLGGRQVGIDRIETQNVAMKGAAERIRQPTTVSVVLVKHGDTRRGALSELRREVGEGDSVQRIAGDDPLVATAASCPS